MKVKVCEKKNGKWFIKNEYKTVAEMYNQLIVQQGIDISEMNGLSKFAKALCIALNRDGNIRVLTAKRIYKYDSGFIREVGQALNDIVCFCHRRKYR